MPPPPTSPSSKTGARRFLAAEEVEEDDDEESDSDPHDDLLAARQINGDSEAEDEGFVNGHDGNSDGGGCGSDGGSDGGGGGSDDDDDIANDKGNDGAMAAAAAEGRPEERRSSMRAGRFEGSLEDRGVNKISPRPTPRKKKAKPNQRLRDRTRNRERFAAKTAAARAEFLAVASSAVEKLGAALDAWLLGKEALWYEHIVDPVQLGDCARAELPRAKVAALVKRAQVVHRYLQLQVKSGNSFRLQNQREVAEAMNISAQLVASWTRDFMHLEPHSDFHAAAGGDTAPVEHRPLTSPPLNPYTVSSEVMPIENDKHIRALATWFVRANANVKGRANMKASDFQRWCITFLIPNHLSELRPYRTKVILTYNNELVTPDGAPAPRAFNVAATLDEAITDADKTWAISLTTAKRWLFSLGFRKTKHKKTMYVDGHERADVVADRRRYIAELDQYLSRMDQYGGDNMDEVTSRTSEEPEVVLVVHDEVVLHQNDGEEWSYQQVNF